MLAGLREARGPRRLELTGRHAAPQPVKELEQVELIIRFFGCQGWKYNGPRSIDPLGAMPTPLLSVSWQRLAPPIRCKAAARSAFSVYWSAPLIVDSFRRRF